MVRQVRFWKYLLLCALGWMIAAAITLSLGGGFLGMGHHSSTYAQTTEFTAAQEEDKDPESTASSDDKESDDDTDSSDGEDSSDDDDASDDKLRPFEDITEDLEKQEGLFTTYSDLQSGEVYLALSPDQLNQNFLLLATLESGLGEAGLFRGWSFNNLLVQFQSAPDNHLKIVVPNTHIRNPGGQGWQQRLLDGSFSDSIIFEVEVISIDPDSEAKLIDLSALFITSDLANLSQSLDKAVSGYSRQTALSRVDTLDVFRNNLELGTTVGYASDGSGGGLLAALLGSSIRGLADDRGFSLGVRYSLSALPEGNGYQPRLADERVGYFLSAFRAPLQPDARTSGRTDPFVRYIHRWHLEKKTPGAALSPPQQPIVFWIENTVPPAYREALRQGALLWNEAFEQAGFEHAIQVEQMPDDADWDPADVRYNTIRWSDSLRSNISGIGQSRVNPLTGEILDADIVLDANVIRRLRQQYQTRGLETASAEAETYLALCGQRSQSWYVQWLATQALGPADFRSSQTRFEALEPGALGVNTQLPHHHCMGYLRNQQMAFGALALSTLPNFSQGQLDDYIQQHLVALTAHEVGHTLGLRHNFAGSRLLSPEQLNNTEVTRAQGLASSIMDYLPPNIAPVGTPQGDFFPTRLGAYDRWAIEYGYSIVPPSPLQRDSSSGLSQITARSHLPALAYATDEDIRNAIDPEARAWDLSNDPLQFAQWQLENAQTVWQRLNRLSVRRGEGYGSLRRRVDLVFSYFWNQTTTLTSYVGGQRFRRLDPWEITSEMAGEMAGEIDFKTPLEPIPADKQRAALNALNQKIFAPDAFQFSPQLLNQLPPDRWRHWGSASTRIPLSYPIYQRILSMQSQALSELLSARRLAHVRDLEFKSDSEDVLTIAELFDTVYQGIWSEVASDKGVGGEVSSLRRGLQRHHLNILTNLVLRRSVDDVSSVQSFMDFTALAATLSAPEDSRVLARYQLRQLYEDIEKTLSRDGGRMAVTTQAHWEDVRDRIEQVLEAPLLGT